MMHSATGIYIPGSSWLHRLDARCALLGFLLLIAATIFADSVLEYGIIALVLLIAALVSNLNPRVTIVPAIRLWPFWILVFLMNTLFYKAEDPFFQWTIFSLSEEGAMHGFQVVAKIVLVIIAANLLTSTTPPMEIMAGMKTLISPLRLFRINTEEIAVILSAAMQFIPVLLEESEQIRKAQIARGARFESRKIHERAMALLPMVVPLFLAAFKRADELALAMEARGYRSDGKRSRAAVRKWKAGDLPGILVPLGLVALTAIL